MELFGVGGFEFALIIIIALIVAGPARMAVWARKLGQWTGQLRNLWKTAATQLQRELDDAGVDFKVPKELPTRRALMDEINRSTAVRELSQPIKEVQSVLEEGRSAAGELSGALSSVERKMLEATSANNPSLEELSRPAPSNGSKPRDTEAPTHQPDGYGTWGSDASETSHDASFGTWSRTTGDT